MGEYKSIRGVPYYPRGYVDQGGTRFYFGKNRGFNCFVVLAGEALQYFRDAGAGDVGVLQWAHELGAKISRLDLAVTDFIDVDFLSMEDVQAWWTSGKITSSLCAGGCKVIDELLEGEERERQTLYIGDQKKRAKKGIFRAYDKGIDLGIGSEIITRIELELKREKAAIAASRIAETGDIAGNFRAYFNVNSPDFERIMEAPAIETSRGKAKPKTSWEDEVNNRWEWLINQVAPALKSAIEDDRKIDSTDKRLIEFMAASGILKDARGIASALSDMKYHDKLLKNQLTERTPDKKE